MSNPARWSAAVWAAGCLVALSAAPALGAADVQAAYELRLAGALGEGKDIELYAVFGPGGRAVHALSAARQYNRMPHDVDASDLKLAGESIAGTVRISIPFDGYVPKGGEPLEADIEIDATVRSGTAAGTYAGKFGGWPRKGELGGRRIQTHPADVPRRLTLACESAVYWEAGKPKRRRTPGARLGMELAVKDGRCFAARLVPSGSITDVAMAAYAGAQDVRLEGHRLTGSLTGTIYPQGQADRPVAYRWTFDGVAIGDRVAGSMAVVEDGKEVGRGRYLGQVSSGAADAGDCLMKLTLCEAVPPHNFMNVFLATRGGKVLHGFGTTPNFNNAIHEVDVSGLEVAADRLTGRLGVTIRPDGWVPRDRKPIPCSFEIDAAITAGEVVGTHTGRFRDAPVQGEAVGRLDPKPDLAQVARVTLKVENSPFGRGFFTLEYEDGRLANGRVWNNHSNLTGEVRKVALDFSGERVGGSLTAFVEKGGATPGVYVIEPDGVLVGTMGAGTATTTAASDGRKKTATFWISLSPAE